MALEEVPDDYKFHLSKGADAGGGDNVTGRDLVEAGRFPMGSPEDCIKFIERFAAIGVELMFNFSTEPGDRCGGDGVDSPVRQAGDPLFSCLIPDGASILPMVAASLRTPRS